MEPLPAVTVSQPPGPAPRRMTTNIHGDSVAISGQYDSVDNDIVNLLREDSRQDLDDPHLDIRVVTARTGSSWYAAVFIVVNAALGAGLLNFPQAFDQSGGIAVAIIIQAILMLFIIGALLILAFCSDVHQCATYQDVVYAMCGRRVQTVCAVVIVLYSYGVCVTFFIIVGDQMDKFFSFVYGDTWCHYWYMNRKFTISVSAVLLVLPMCYPRRIDFLKYASAAGVVAVIYCVILVTVQYFVGGYQPGPIKTKPERWTDVFLVVPVICFAYQCHISVVPIYACLKVRTQKEFLKTVMIALGICIFAYTCTASFGYYTFGTKVKADILSSYSPTPAVLVGVILIAAKMITTYPILLFVGRAAFDSVWAHVFNLEPEDVALGERTRRIVVTTIWFGTSLALAVVVPDISAVISVLGGMAALFIFAFPGLCLFQVLKQGFVKYEESKKKYICLMAMAVGYLIIGAFFFGLVTTQAVYSDIANANNAGQASSVNESHQCENSVGFKAIYWHA